MAETPSNPNPPRSPATPIPTAGLGSAPVTLPFTVMAPICSVFRRFLKSQHLKYTPERADILNAIIDFDDVFEAEELLLRMRTAGHDVSKATIYRTIHLLQEAGIITQALFDAKQAHYQLIYGKAPRYVSRERLVTMLGHEYQLLQDRLQEKRGDRTCFFVYADTVATASAVQVREPLHRGAMQRWKRFEPQLQPLRELLEQGGIEI